MACGRRPEGGDLPEPQPLNVAGPLGILPLDGTGLQGQDASSAAIMQTIEESVQRVMVVAASRGHQLDYQVIESNRIELN